MLLMAFASRRLRMSQAIVRSMALDDLARTYNPYIRGWINYYRHFYKSAPAWTLRRVDAFLIRWARNKFKRLRLRPRGAREWFSRVVRGNPNLFAHWGFLHVSDRTSYHPMARQENETLGRVGALDDLDCPVAEAFECHFQLVARIASAAGHVLLKPL